MDKIYKNSNGKFETEDGWTLSCGSPIALNVGDNDKEQWIEGRVEHNGKDYYFHCPNGKHINLKDGDQIKGLW